MPTSPIPCPGCGRSIDSRKEVCADCRARGQGDRTILDQAPGGVGGPQVVYWSDDPPTPKAPYLPRDRRILVVNWVILAAIIAGMLAAFLLGILFGVTGHLQDLIR